MPTGDSAGEYAKVYTAVTPTSIPYTTAPSSRRLSAQQGDPPQQTRPQLQRGQSQIQNVIANSAKFVGIPYAEKQPDLSEWDSRRLRYLNKRYKLKDSVKSPFQLPAEGVDSVLSPKSPVAPDTPSIDARYSTGGPSLFARSTSVESRPRLEKKDSVAKVLYDTVSSIIKRGTTHRPKPRHAPLATRSSFDIADLDDLNMPIVTSSKIEPVPEISEEPEESSEMTEAPITSSDSEWVKLDDSVSGRSSGTQPFPFGKRFRQPSLPVQYDELGNPIVRPPHCFAQIKISSTAPMSISEVQEESIESEDEKPPIRKSKSWTEVSQGESTPLKDDAKQEFIYGLQDSQLRTNINVPYRGPPDVGSSYITKPPQKVALLPPQPAESKMPDRPFHALTTRKISRQPQIDEPDEKQQANRLLETLSQGLVPRQKTRYRGVTPISRLCRYHLGKSEVKKLNPKVQEIIERGEDHRPFFTYWITTVQVLVLIISLITYGIGNFAFLERVEVNGEVKDTSLANRRVSYYEPTNIWFGPSLRELVLLGAKYSPCMRRERGVWNDIESERRRENRTGCCIYNDKKSTQNKFMCYQSSEKQCPKILASWNKWTKDKNGHDNPVVCGQDPNYCENPKSTPSKEWPSDIAKWPICKKLRESGQQPKHMSCEVTGRPCCIQMQGLCRITTKDYCDFVKGHWHSTATLCSQVDCFGDICGMLPFVNKDHPNQVYRLFTSLFIHAGIFHLIITLLVHRFLMLDLELMIGWKRMAAVYLGSGIGGNLASAIFVPYNPEVGPSGSQVAILAALIVDVIHHRKVITDWERALAVHVCIVISLLIVGTVPFIDNWAHLFGFFFGLLLSIGFFPYIDFAESDSIVKTIDEKKKSPTVYIRRRTILVTVSLILAASLYFLLFYIYFANIEINCSFCGYLNCINWVDHYCDNKGLELTHWLPI